MPELDNCPAWVGEICERVAKRLAAIKGVRAVAIGGSRARGTAREDSDLDLGLYYDSSVPFAIEELNAAARQLDDLHAGGLLTPLGAWGPGVNGGGWLLIGGHHVDFLYRDLVSRPANNFANAVSSLRVLSRRNKSFIRPVGKQVICGTAY